MALLLGARGRLGARKGGGFLAFVRGSLESLTGRSWRSEQRSQRGRSIPGWIAAAGVLVAFAGGFLAGGRFGGGGDAGLHMQDGSRQNGAGQAGGSQTGNCSRTGNSGDPTSRPQGNNPITGTPPSVLDPSETAKLSSKALAVCGYNQAADAKAMSAALRARGCDKARPYEVQAESGSVWLVVVYYDGDTKRQETIQLLQSLTGGGAPAELRDAVAERAKAENKGSAWPYEWVVK